MLEARQSNPNSCSNSSELPSLFTLVSCPHKGATAVIFIDLQDPLSEEVELSVEGETGQEMLEQSDF